MQYAIVEGQRREAFKGGRGTCERCGGEAISKCGPRVADHWAHRGRRHCDPWWENETPWHRDWKNLFPEECREVVQAAPSGEKHIADIKTPTGIVIEVQHSSITDVERLSREEFYKNMLWVVDARSFSDRFQVCHRLPNPETALGRELGWLEAAKGMQGGNSGIFWRHSEDSKGDRYAAHELHSIDKVIDEINATWAGDAQYYWVRPRSAWLDSSVPVFLDFGSRWMFLLGRHPGCNIKCIRFFSCDMLVRRSMTAKCVSEIVREPDPLVRSLGADG